MEYAMVTKVEVSGADGNYIFSVTISSPDEGCNQYADWWEVVSDEGILLYRRILRHSHVSEQPFARSGGPVKIKEDELVYVRAHMNNTGYGSQVMKGTIKHGFTTFHKVDFPMKIEKSEPLPSQCSF